MNDQGLTVSFQANTLQAVPAYDPSQGANAVHYFDMPKVVLTQFKTVAEVEAAYNYQIVSNQEYTFFGEAARTGSAQWLGIFDATGAAAVIEVHALGRFCRDAHQCMWCHWWILVALLVDTHTHTNHTSGIPPDIVCCTPPAHYLPAYTWRAQFVGGQGPRFVRNPTGVMANQPGFMADHLANFTKWCDDLGLEQDEETQLIVGGFSVRLCVSSGPSFSACLRNMHLCLSVCLSSWLNCRWRPR